MTRRGGWPVRGALGLAAILLVVAAIAWRRAARAPAPALAALPPAAPVVRSLERPPAPPPQLTAAAERPRAALDMPVAPYPDTGATGISRDDPLTAYRKANVYPPTSRPLSSEQTDLLRPNQRHETMRPADHGDGVRYLFTADRYYVIGDETLTATLVVERDGAPLAVTITRALATVRGAVTPQDRIIPLTYAATGTAGTQYTHTFAPARLGLSRQAQITMTIEFHDGFAGQRADFDFEYTPTAGIPARFTGGFHDLVRDGSLVIRVELAVTTPGSYLLDANLFDAADQPVAWSRFKGELAAGVHDAELVFFGKVIRDADAAGPFRLGQLRGARFAPGRDPDLEQMPPFTGMFTTRPYPADAFSDAEWDSPDKQRMIELLGQQPASRGAAAPPR